VQSYNATLNTVVEATFDPLMFGPGGIVLGVEADGTDGAIDGNQLAHVINPVANQPTPSDFLIVSQNGSNSGSVLTSGASVLISTTGTPQIAGPSVGNYRAESIAGSFEDISGTGTKIAASDWVTNNNFDDQSKELTSSDLVNFSFDFYDTNYNDLFINQAGTITFGGPSEESQFFTDWTQDTPVRPRIAPLWDEFDLFTVPGDVYGQVKDPSLPTERFVVNGMGSTLILILVLGLTKPSLSRPSCKRTVVISFSIIRTWTSLIKHSNIHKRQRCHGRHRHRPVSVSEPDPGEYIHRWGPLH